MGYDKDTKQYGNVSSGRQKKTSEQRAREQAYQEYLSLRENRSSRGNYVRNDDLYGEYFSGRSSIENTPYGTSEMRRRSQKHRSEQTVRRERSEQLARQGRVNKADLDKPAGRDSRAEYEAARASVSKREKRKAKRRRKNGRGLRVAVIVVLILVLGIGGVLGAGMAVVKNTLDNVGRVELDPTMIGINPQVDEELKNYRNIALIGIDARDMSNDEGVRSDAIIIVSIDKETKEIKMFSVYRDTMLYLGEDAGLDKMAHAYYYGGPTRVLYTLNKNLDLNVKEVVVVNWKAVADTVDALGGLDIEIQESEINEMNKYIKDTQKNIGGSKALIESAGMQTLNGNQAVTYARIRKDAATGDYRRNERMKIVVKATFEKAKEIDPKTLRKISREIMPQIKTNMSTADMMGLALKVTSYNMTDSVGFPYDHSDYNHGVFYGVPVTLSTNITKLHEQFFAQDGYTPTEEAQNISGNIAAKTGYY